MLVRLRSASIHGSLRTVQAGQEIAAGFVGVLGRAHPLRRSRVRKITADACRMADAGAICEAAQRPTNAPLSGEERGEPLFWRFTSGCTWAGGSIGPRGRVRRSPAPLMRAGASLRRHAKARLARKEPQVLLAPELLSEYDGARRARRVHLENVLGEIQADGGNLFHGRLPPVVSTPPLGTSMPSGASTLMPPRIVASGGRASVRILVGPQATQPLRVRRRRPGCERQRDRPTLDRR